MAYVIRWGKTNRGKPLVINKENHEYRFYLCRKYDSLKCRAIMAIVEEQGDIGELIGTHCHRSNISKIVAHQIVTDQLDLAWKNPDLPFPKEPEDYIEIPPVFSVFNEKPFLKMAEMVDGKPMVVFFSEFGQNVLESNSTRSGDGTFACVPSGFAQMYDIFGSRDRHVFPAVYAFSL